MIVVLLQLVHVLHEAFGKDNNVPKQFVPVEHIRVLLNRRCIGYSGLPLHLGTLVPRAHYLFNNLFWRLLGHYSLFSGGFLPQLQELQ